MAMRQTDLSPSPKTALYLRISKDSEGRGLGVARQEKDCRTLAAFKGWPVDGTSIYIDNDRSATRKNGRAADRPEFRRLLIDIEAGRVDAVIAWDFDRLARDPLEAEQFFLLCERAGMHRVATPADDVNIESGEGLLIARIKSAVASEETRKMSKRIRSKKLQLAEAGHPTGGQRRYGYTPDGMTVIEEEADVLREAAARVLAGRSLGVLCRELTEAGISTTRGGVWRQTSLRRALLWPAIAGLREHQGVIIGEAQWPAIIDRGTWEAVCSILNDPSRKPLAGHRATRLLTGILRCSCGTRLTASSGGTRRGGEPRYQCPSANGGCGKVGIAGRHIEPLVIGAVREALASPEFVAAYRAADQGEGNDTEALAAEVTVCEGKLRELATSWGNDEIGKAEWLTARATVEARLDDARSHLAAYHVTRTPLEGLVGPGVFDAAWPEKTMDEKRAIIADLIESVTVHPAKTRGGRIFDPARVAPPVWKV
jgi:site-specific DNA recombinase